MEISDHEVEALIVPMITDQGKVEVNVAIREHISFDASFKNMVGKFRSSTQNLGRIAGELQEGVMKIRMVPISQIFSRFPRVVRDLSRDLNKKINLQIEGDDTELDKAIIEDLLDPIMHCVRNSVDHGIESPEERKAAGKDEEGTVLLKASNEGNLIIIDIIDDGKGIDVSKIKKKAVERGLIHPDKIGCGIKGRSATCVSGIQKKDTLQRIYFPVNRGSTNKNKSFSDKVFVSGIGFI